jgi:ammonium transporter, Amt family
MSHILVGFRFLINPSGLVRRKNALSLIWACFFANSVATATWYLWGYSLAFSSTATNGFIGNLDFIVHHGVLGAPSTGSPLIPSLAYSFFQLEACCVTVAIIIGAVAERGRLMPAMVFIFVWVTLVYAPVAYWAWNPNGWAFKFGVLDFAGGGPVEIGSGVGGLAYSWILGRRAERETANFRSYSPVLISLGTFILWFGWIGFNAGSAFGANLRAVYAALNTCISAAVAGIVWVLVSFDIYFPLFQILTYMW